MDQAQPESLITTKVSPRPINRRAMLKLAAAGTLLSLASPSAPARQLETVSAALPTLRINPQPRFELSRHLYMQFMEPLGSTDGSVAAAWDHLQDRWGESFMKASRELAPPLMRWGGCFSSYYRWKEAVGPRDRRQQMFNLLWGGMESNQVGTVEFVDFCRQVGAEALMAVNFESDGRKGWMKDPRGSLRSAGPAEAAEWVAYCNQPDNRDRLADGLKDPCTIPLWQIGNETSYDRNGFDLDTTARKTLEFARTMRRADPMIKLIGWGDSGWAPRMAEIAGEELQYLAFHHMYAPGGKNSPLHGNDYRKDPTATWEALMEAHKPHEARLVEMRQQASGTKLPLALTECHWVLPGPNRNFVLSSWAAGVAMARLLNVHTRHGDVLKIATAADFCGTRWQNNAVLIGDHGQSYLQPVAQVMRLYRHHVGDHAVAAEEVPAGLDVTVSRTGNHIFVHVINTHRNRAVPARLIVAGMRLISGDVFEIAAEPEFEVWMENRETISPRQKSLPVSGEWTFPAASVSAIELKLAPSA